MFTAHSDTARSPQPAKRALRLSVVARQLDVHERTVRYWVAAGDLRAHKRGPRLWFIYPEDLSAFLTARSDYRN